MKTACGAALERHAKKHFVSDEITVYEDANIIVRRSGNSLRQYKKLKPGDHIAIVFIK